MTLGFTLAIALAAAEFIAGMEAYAQNPSTLSAPQTMTAKYSVGAEVYGLTPYPVRSRGLRLGYFINDSAECELSYVTAKTTILQTDFKYSELSINLNIFPDPEINWGVGLSIRQVELNYSVSEIEDDLLHGVFDKQQGLAINAHFGFQFSYFDRLTIGSDIITVSAPVHWIRQTSNFPTNASEKEENPRDYPIISTGFSTNMQFLRTFIKVRI